MITAKEQIWERLQRLGGIARSFVTAAQAVVSRLPIVHRLSDDRMRPTDLGLVFAVVFGVTFFVQLPAALAVRMLIPQGVYVQTVSGSFWDIRFENLVYEGRQFSRGRFEPAILPMLIGRMGGAFSLSGAGGVFTGSVQHAGSETTIFHRLDGSFNSSVVSASAQVPLSIGFESRDLELDRSGACHGGTVELSVSTRLAFAGTLFPSGLNWRGSGVCEAGGLSFVLIPDDSAANSLAAENVKLEGTLNGTGLGARITIQLPQANRGDVAIINVLRFSGFKEMTDGWVLPLEGRI